MLGFYEEMANFAAMSEDAGYLGQCASEPLDPPITTLADSAVTTITPGPANIRRRPQQLQLLSDRGPLTGRNSPVAT